MLRRLGLASDTLLQLYESFRGSDEEEERLFGKRREFLGNPLYRSKERGRKYGDVYGSFGARRRHVKEWDPLTEELLLHASDIDTEHAWQSLPAWVQAQLLPQQIGSYVDQALREYVPMTDGRRGSENLGWYQLRLPQDLYGREGALRELGFPQNGELLWLRGRGLRMQLSVEGGPSQPKILTALIQLTLVPSSLQEVDYGDYDEEMDYIRLPG